VPGTAGPGGGPGGPRRPAGIPPNPGLDSPSGGPALGLAIDAGVGVPIVAWSLTTALGVILFAFLLRRPVPAHAMSAAVARLSLGATTSPTLPQVSGESALEAGEAGLPRWLRPSLRAERQAGERGTLPIHHQPARFDSSPRAGADRRTIGYRLVRVSDGPDDVRSSEIGRVDRGDEVEVIGEHEGFLKVRTPGGLEGWVPRVVIVG
jgi:hypothetical protein